MSEFEHSAESENVDMMAIIVGKFEEAAAKHLGDDTTDYVRISGDGSYEEIFLSSLDQRRFKLSRPLLDQDTSPGGTAYISEVLANVLTQDGQPYEGDVYRVFAPMGQGIVEKLPDQTPGVSLFRVLAGPDADSLRMTIKHSSIEINEGEEE